MHKRVVPYVHLLLYQCQECAEPVALAVKSDEANLERIDGDFNEVQCKCGWFKKLLGVEAKSHYGNRVGKLCKFRTPGTFERSRCRPG